MMRKDLERTMEEERGELLEAQPALRDEEAVFATEEIKIEEMAIDGICGVY